MTSEKQIAANRQNSQKSTGPKSHLGLMHSSGNAVKHGLTAKTLIITGEDPKELERLLEQFIATYQPFDATEMELVGQLTVAAWKIRRGQRIEADLFKTATTVCEEGDKAHAEIDDMVSKSNYADAVVKYESLMASDRFDAFLPFDQLGRYAANAERSFYRALQALEHLREKRGIKVALPPVERKTG